ncbi:MAG: aminotransferase class III-fold pyridoxal phosphate-dependent enzyme [Paracoccaceae bacterium]
MSMQAFTQAPPAFTPEALLDIARTHWGVDGRLKALVSERDQNARLDTGAGSFVLKIANAGEDPEQIALQAATLAHLSGVGVKGLPQVIATLKGEDAVTVDLEGRRHIVRLVRWVGGTPLAAAPRSLAQLSALGAYLGRLSRGLQGFGHPAAFRPDFAWSLDHVGGLRDHVGDIADPARRALVAGLFERYEARVLPRLSPLRASVLHQDANDNNVIVAADDPDRIAGLIDFGDMCHGRTVNELAVALAYALLDAPDLYAASRALISHYAAEFPITEDEAGVLYDLMRMRLAASVCLSSRQAALHPENTYLTVSQAPAFALLERLDQIDPEFFVALYRKAAGHDATAGAKRVRTFLAGARPSALFDPDVATSARIALLTDGSQPGMPAFSDRAFDGWFAAQRPENLPETEAFYGTGPYGEHRTVYATDQFADAASPERRTRHLGVDIFAAAGTPVHAPFAGVVEHVAYNADPLDYGHTLILRHETDDGTAFWTLYGHMGGSLPGLLQPGERVEPGQLIAHFGDWHENGGWSPHLHLNVMTDMLSQTGGNFAGVGHASLWDVWADICPDPNLILRLEPESFTVDPAPPQALAKRRSDRLGPSLSTAYAEPLKIVRGQGAWLIDHTGRRFLDAVNNITHVGHCHPHVVAALAGQAERLNTNTRYLSEPILDYADRLVATLPGDLGVAYFVNSGTEANELALRIARTALGKPDTVVLDWAYHGNSGGMVAVSPYKFKRKGGFAQPDHVQIAAFPDPYRGPHRGMTEATGRAYGADIGRCLDAVAARTGDGAAAFIAESLSGVGGQVIYPPGYLAAAYAAVRERGGLCIADEVQCGFGRVGSHFWGFETQGVVPDIVVMGKPMGNGHPMGAVVTTPELAARFANGMEYFNSFGGNPVSMAVGRAVLDVIEDEGLQARAAETGTRLKARLGELAGECAAIGDVRGMGLFLGVELVADREARQPATALASRVVNHMRQQGVLISTDGPFDNVLKIKPPMVFTAPEADRLVAVLRKSLSACC